MIFSKDRKDKSDVTLEGGDGFHKGKLLVSTPLIQDSCFAKSVVLICDHSPTGAMGLIVNKHLRNIDQDDLHSRLGLEKPADSKADIEVYFGGPVETNRGFVIHSADYTVKNTIKITPEVSVTSEYQILSDYLHDKGPKNLSLIMGYSGWVGGQLEKEIEKNSWVVFPAEAELIFGTHDDSKWQQAGLRYGIDVNQINTVTGNA